MKQVSIRKGKVSIEDVPAPLMTGGDVLVQVQYSTISVGTELASVATTATPLYRRILDRPQNLRKALDLIRTQGVEKMVQVVRAKVGAPSYPGYSASGVVLSAGDGVTDLATGDTVACAGAGIASHAQFVAVPRKLTVRVPYGLPADLASTVALGSIALQGVRRAEVTLGEFVAVVGLGLLGQLTAQMLKAAGCRVVGIDLDQSRLERALALGMDAGFDPSTENVVEAVHRFSDGRGADAVIVAAATGSSEPLNEAMKMCRRKGRLVVVGAVGMNVDREEFYKKELDLLISTSYGPGRYDDAYEQKGQDYPYAYVRWTENRNMLEYLRLLADQKVQIRPLIDRTYSIRDAARAYEDLSTESGARPLAVVLQYDEEPIPDKKKVVVRARCPAPDQLNVAVIGAGSFSSGVLLPCLRKLGGARIYGIADTKGTRAKSTASTFGAMVATTDFRELLADDDVHAVAIATRHNLHAEIVMEAARAGKAVFVEKPMSLNRGELADVVEVLQETRVPFMVGFNRRFSKFGAKIAELTGTRIDPLVIHYRMNAGFLPKEHWINSPEEGGGRNIGEACHIYDLFGFFTRSEVHDLSAFSVDPKTERCGKNDNFVAALKYADGSVCNLVYTSLGAADASKEHMELFVDGKIVQLDDYRSLRVLGGKSPSLEKMAQNKGHYDELEAFVRSIREGDGYAIPLWELVQTTEISFRVEENLRAAMVAGEVQA